MAVCSYLFVPADRPERFAKALASGAGAVIVDLEDAVAPAAKADARSALAAWLDGPAATPVVMRINAAGTLWFANDLRLARHPAVAAVVVPKAEDAGLLATVAKPLLPLVESAAGFDALREIAAEPGVRRLLFGSIDFQADLGIEGDDDALLLFRSQLVLVSRRDGLAAPVDGVTTAVDDEAAVTHDTLRARRLGFGAKLCIHPRQVAVVNRAFRPSDAEADWARRVLAATAAGGVVTVDGKMVDAPVLLRVRALPARLQP
jgi:citrate lyase subunit beta/citryl-CoA lyase